LGTLTELAVVWGIAALGGEPGRPRPRIIAYRDPWQPLVGTLVTALGVPPEYGDLITFVDSAAEAAAACTAAYASAEAAAATPAPPPAGSGGEGAGAVVGGGDAVGKRETVG
jgi:predicted Rossmann-fold nucleotide-binding protein